MLWQNLYLEVSSKIIPFDSIEYISGTIIYIRRTEGSQYILVQEGIPPQQLDAYKVWINSRGRQ